MANLLSARNISKSYSTQDLFQYVTVHIEESERLGIIGPNGSGKSTLLKILAQLEEVDEGEITNKAIAPSLVCATRTEIWMML